MSQETAKKQRLAFASSKIMPSDFCLQSFGDVKCERLRSDACSLAQHLLVCAESRIQGEGSHFSLGVTLRKALD